MPSELSDQIARGIRIGALLAGALYAVILAWLVWNRRTVHWSRTRAIGAAIGAAAALSLYLSSNQFAAPIERLIH